MIDLLRFYTIEAVRQIWANKLRSFLSVLGILIGTASVVAMVSISELSSAQILSQFEKMGTNLLSLNWSINSNDALHPTQKSLHSLSLITNNITAIAPYALTYKPVQYQGNNINAQVAGVTTTMKDIAHYDLAQGRHLSFLDHDHYVCLVGFKLYQQIKKEALIPPLGQQIRIGHYYYTIVGILKPWPENFFLAIDFNHAIVVPLSTLLSSEAHSRINNAVMRIGNNTLIQSTKMHIEQYLTTQFPHLQLQISSPETLIKNMQKSSHTMTLVNALIGSIALLVGGIGVMNIMLVSVTERRREIGIRLAIGAKRKDIQWQFLIEATTLSLFGGIFGMLLGIITTYIVAHHSHWAFHLLLTPSIIGCGISMLIGIFFGFYPAHKAAQLDPIETLRSE